MEVELIDITEAEQEDDDYEEAIRFPSAQSGAVVGTLEEPTESTTPYATTIETTTEAIVTTVGAPIGALSSQLKAGA